jgi:hypothetical protein
MLEKVLPILNHFKAVGIKLIGLAPFPAGIAVGYLFKPEIKFIVTAAINVTKTLLKL